MTDELKTQIINRWNSGENTASISCDLDIPLEEVNMTIVNKLTPRPRYLNDKERRFLNK